MNSASSLAIAIDDDSSISGTALEIKPGTISSATEVTIIEGESLVSSENKQSIGADLQSAGPSVVVTSSAFEDPAIPIPMALAIDPSLTLLNEGSENKPAIGILYMSVIYGEQFKIVLGIIPSSTVTLIKGRVKFEAPFFGSYQPVFLPAEVDKEFRLEIDRDILSKGGSVMVVDGGDKTPPIPGGEGVLSVLSLAYDHAAIGFEIAEDNFSESKNLAYLAYYSLTSMEETISSVEDATPVGDYKRKVTAINIPDLAHGKTYYINIIVRDEMNNKALYKQVTIETPTPNFAPVIESVTPAANTLSLHYQDNLKLEVTASDLNPSDTLTYEWALNGDTSQRLVSDGNEATFIPSIDYAGLNIIDVMISDGEKTTRKRWEVNVHMLNKYCLDLEAGEICTIVGRVEVGNDMKPSESNDKIRIFPHYLDDDGEGNLFITDGELNGVWFYNRGMLPVTRLGQTIPAGTLKLIVGNGATSVGDDGEDALEFEVGSPFGIAYDSSRGNLYIALYDSSVVVRINSEGKGHTVFGTGSNLNNASTNTDGIVATTSVCYRPMGLDIKESSDELFVACYGSNAVKKVSNVSATDLNSITATIVVGASTNQTLNSNVDGALGRGGDARTKGPAGVKIGPDGNVYFSEYGGCYIRVANIGVTDISFFQTNVPVLAGHAKNIIGTGSCSISAGDYSQLRFRSPRDLAILANGTVVEGFFITNDYYDRITFVNNTASDITIGGRTISPSQGHYVLGTGSGSYNGDSSSGISSRVNNVYGLIVSTNKLIFADTLNRRVRSLKIDSGDGSVATEIGSGKGIRGFSGDLPQAADAAEINEPYGLVVKDQELFFGDLRNYRIRSLNLKTGLIKTAVSSGYGEGGDELAATTKIRNVRGMVMEDDVLFFAEDYSPGANVQCKVRAYNTSLQDKSIFGALIEPNWVRDIAGNFELGCTTYDQATYGGGSALDAPLRLPQDVAIADGALYIVSDIDHCIMKVSPDGTINLAIGECGSAGDDDGNMADGTAKLKYPAAIKSDPKNPKNLFVIDDSSVTVGTLRYANFSDVSVTVLGVTIEPGDLTTLKSFPTRYLRSVALYEKQICVSAGDYQIRTPSYYHGIVCFDRESDGSSYSLVVNSDFTGTSTAGRPISTIQEGVPASEATVYGPSAITFDADGNLFIAETRGHIIRKVKRWWP